MKIFHLYQLYNPGRWAEWIVALISSTTVLTCGMAFAWPSPALLKIRNEETDFTMSSYEQSWMVTIAFIGNLITPIITIYSMDSIGRRNTLTAGLILMITSWLLIIFMKSAWSLFLARFLMGGWSGIAYMLAPIYSSEMVSSDIRGAAGTLMGLMLYIGALFESVIGTFVSYEMLAVVSFFVPFIVFIAFLFVPESPYYYLKNNNRSEAEQSLSWLRNKDILNIHQELDLMEITVKEQMGNPGRFVDIFKTKEVLKAFFLVEFFGAMQRMAGLTVLFAFASITIPDSFITGEESSIVLDIVWIISSIISAPLMDRQGRKFLMIISCIGSGILMFLSATWYYLRDCTKIDITPFIWMPLILFCCHGFFYSIGIVSIPMILQGEMFPVNLKAKASALSTITMAIFSGISTNIYIPLTEYVGMYLNFVICGISSICGAVVAITMMIETKGKTLEEIQIMLREKSFSNKN